MLGEHADDDGVVGLGGLKGEPESGAHGLRGLAVAAGAIDLEDQALFRGLTDSLQHGFAVGMPEEFPGGFAAGEPVCFFAGPAEVVEAGHVKVEVPAFILNIIDDFRNVSAEAGAGSGVAHCGEGLFDLVDLACLPEGIGAGAVVVDADGLFGHQVADVAGGVFDFGGGLGDPVDRTTLQPVLVEEAEDVAVGAGLPGIDAVTGTVAKEALRVFGREVVDHLAVCGRVHMGVTTDGIAADDEAGDLVRAEGDSGHGGGRGGGEGGGGEGLTAGESHDSVQPHLEIVNSVCSRSTPEDKKNILLRMLNASRRGFLRATLGPAWLAGALMEKSLLRAAAARSGAAQADSDLFTLEKMGDGVWAALAKPTTWVNCHGAVFELSDGLLVVDSHSKPSAAAALVAQIRKEVSAKPVRYLVNSHFHWDHTQGNQTYRGGTGDVRIIASDSTRRLLSEGAETRLKQAVENAEKALAGAKERRGAASGEERLRLDRAVGDTESYVKELKSLKLELPDITVKGDLTLHDRHQELRIVFRGRGHTEGDIAVLSPSRRALATGDLAHGVIPYIGDGYPLDWPKTLGEVAKLEFDKFCGGHGRVETGKLRMDQMRGYLEEMTTAVVEGKRAGKTVEQLRKEITPANLKSMGGGYLESVSGGRGAAAVAGGIAANVAQVYAALGRD